MNEIAGSIEGLSTGNCCSGLLAMAPSQKLQIRPQAGVSVSFDTEVEDKISDRYLLQFPRHDWGSWDDMLLLSSLRSASGISGLASDPESGL